MNARAMLDANRAVETLLYYLYNKGNISDLGADEFESEEEFLHARINLFNLVSINSIVSLSPNFNGKDLEEIIGGIQILNTSGNTNNRKIYNDIIDSLKNGSYTFDGDNNVVIKANGVRAIVRSLWLYNLAAMSKKNTFLRVFLFNKNAEMDIHDENSLLNYLYHTKMFLVRMSGNQSKLDDNYNRAVRNTKGMLIDKSSIKSDEIAETLFRNIPKRVKASVAKYDFNNYIMFLEKAKKGDFYDKSLVEQKEMIKGWIIEDEVASIEANVNLSRLIVLLNGQKSYEEISSLVNVDMCIAALFKMYMYILLNMDVDYGSLYLSKIRIKNYVDQNLVNNYIELRQIIKEINSPRFNDELVDLRRAIKGDIVSCNISRGEGKSAEVNDFYEKIKKGIRVFVERSKEQEELNRRRNTKQNIIHYERSALPMDLAFDANKIMDLIGAAIEDGRIYLLGDNIYVEINNKEMGMNILKLVISKNDLMYFIESSNEMLDKGLNGSQILKMAA